MMAFFPWVGSSPCTSKVRMIKTLMGGWISDEDVTAIVRICSGVKTHAQAEIIRSGVNPLNFSSIGQRTRVRVAFTIMP